MCNVMGDKKWKNDETIAAGLIQYHNSTHLRSLISPTPFSFQFFLPVPLSSIDSLYVNNLARLRGSG